MALWKAGAVPVAVSFVKSDDPDKSHKGIGRIYVYASLFFLLTFRFSCLIFGIPLFVCLRSSLEYFHFNLVIVVRVICCFFTLSNPLHALLRLFFFSGWIWGFLEYEELLDSMVEQGVVDVLVDKMLEVNALKTVEEHESYRAFGCAQCTAINGNYYT